MQSYLFREFPFIVTVYILFLKYFHAQAFNEAFLLFKNSENQTSNKINGTDDGLFEFDDSSLIFVDVNGNRNLSLFTNGYSAFDFYATVTLEDNSESGSKSKDSSIIFIDKNDNRNVSLITNGYSVFNFDTIVTLENNSQSGNKSDDSNITFIAAYDHSNLSVFRSGFTVFDFDTIITVENSTGSWNKSILEILDLHTFEGNRPNETDTKSLSVYKNFEEFLVIDNGSSLSIELFKNQSDAITSVNETLLMHESNETKFIENASTNDSRICHENNFCGLLHCNRETKRRISCYSSETEYDLRQDFRPDHVPTASKKYDMQHPTNNALCYIQITGDSSYYALHNFVHESSVHEIRVVFEQVNRILSRTDFDGDGQQDNLSLRIQDIILKEASNFPDDNNGTQDFAKLIDNFREQPQDKCLSLLLVAVPTDSDFISTAYISGICKHNKNESDLARNIALVNLVDRHGYKRSLFATAWTIAMVVGQVMGSVDNECDPMFPFPPEENRASFFSDCGRQNIANKLMTQGTCLKYPEKAKYTPKPKKNKQEVLKSPCGNGRVDPGEECDCGTKEQCKKMRSCCVPQGKKKECHYDRSKGYECDWTEDCCTRSCEIVPKFWNLFCGSGDASCAPEGSYCNGESSRCPVPKLAAHLLNGQRCSPGTLKQAGAATCQNGQCNSTICMDAELEDCTCAPSTKHQCRVCCRHAGSGRRDPGPCIPAEYFNLNSRKEKYIYRHPGTLCSEVRLGHCDGHGNCVRLGMAQSSAVQWIVHQHSYIVISTFTYWMFPFWYFEF